MTSNNYLGTFVHFFKVSASYITVKCFQNDIVRINVCSHPLCHIRHVSNLFVGKNAKGYIFLLTKCAFFELIGQGSFHAHCLFCENGKYLKCPFTFLVVTSATTLNHFSKIQSSTTGMLGLCMWMLPTLRNIHMNY